MGEAARGPLAPAPPGGEPRADAAGLRRALIALCVTEITSWGVLYYAFPVMLSSLTRATGWSTGAAMGAFSTGLAVSALAGVAVGRLMDRHGPRLIMTVGSLIGVAAVLAVAAAPSLPWFFAAWLLVGVAQSTLLYPPAFSALTRWYGPRRVRALTALSLVGGLASTVFAPLTAALVERLEWRMTYVALAALLGLITFPLHALCLTPAWPAEARHRGRANRAGHVRAVLRSRAFVLLVVAMALASFGLYSAAINLVPLLTGRGMGNTLAAIALGLYGAGQVLGRLGYATLTRRTSTRARSILVLVAGGGTVAVLAALPGPTAALIAAAVLAGSVRGIYTLLQATSISDRWGTRSFATLNGLFSAPTTAATAVAPAGGSLLAGWLGGYPPAFALLAVLVLAGAAIATGSAPPPATAGGDGRPAPGRAP
jgi:MFS family permease